MMFNDIHVLYTHMYTHTQELYKIKNALSKCVFLNLKSFIILIITENLMYN